MRPNSTFTSNSTRHPPHWPFLVVITVDCKISCFHLSLIAVGDRNLLTLLEFSKLFGAKRQTGSPVETVCFLKFNQNTTTLRRAYVAIEKKFSSRLLETRTKFFTVKSNRGCACVIRCSTNMAAREIGVNTAPARCCNPSLVR